MTRDFEQATRIRTGIKVAFAVLVICYVLFIFGKYIFDLFGITLDAFRIGAGAILFLSAISLINSNPSTQKRASEDDNIAVVPLAIPITVGPGAIGALMVMGAESHSIGIHLINAGAVACSVSTVGLLLCLSSKLERLIGQQGLTILTKLTGLFVSALAAQIFFTGLKNFLA